MKDKKTSKENYLKGWERRRMKTVKMASILGEWKGELGKDSLKKFEEDLEAMFGGDGVGVYVKYQPTPNCWELKIFREEEE